MRPSQYIAAFDSSSAMLAALGRFLHGRAFPMLGQVPFSVPPVAVVNRLPRWIQEQIYIWSGRAEGVTPDGLRAVDSEAIGRWIASHFPKRRYPAVMIGSSNGALVHLCAALGVPWIPQTFLTPVRHDGVPPDEPRYALEAFREAGRVLLASNPDIVLHHMHDANQDRLMIQRMAYFRWKRLKLGAALERFVADCIEPGGTIILVDCRLRWPTTVVAERHVFQHGALGGATLDDYFGQGSRVQDLLRRYGSHRRWWDPPPPDGESPEAEWGFDDRLADDVRRFAEERGLRVERLTFEDPEDLSPVVADLYTRWYAARGISASRLVVDSFILMDPWWTLRTGSVPFWMVFNTEPSHDALRRYLGAREPFDCIHLMLFSHGADSIGLVPIERWRTLIARARVRSEFLGVDTRAYPRDFAVFARYHRAIKRIPSRLPLPAPLPLDVARELFAVRGASSGVRWTEELSPAPSTSAHP